MISGNGDHAIQIEGAEATGNQILGNLIGTDVTGTVVLGNGGRGVNIENAHSMPDTEFRIEFFANEACDPLGHGEGETFLGYTMVTTDGDGDASFTETLPAPLPVGAFITATATDSNRNTSEFSACVAAT